MRLNQFLAHAGLGSRRSVEEPIRAGRVRINGVPADLSSQVNPDTDQVTLDGKPVTLPESFTYIVLNKPSGYTVTRTDPKGKSLVYEIIPKPWQRLAYVGRLDRESEGVLIFTDDGVLAHKLLRPEYRVEKEYIVHTRGPIPADTVERFTGGVTLDEGFVAKAVNAEVRPRADGGGTIKVILCEGKKREVRQMCRVLGIPVDRLVRTRFGPIELGKLASGDSRVLESAEIQALQKSVLAPKKSVPK